MFTINMPLKNEYSEKKILVSLPAACTSVIMIARNLQKAAKLLRMPFIIFSPWNFVNGRYYRWILCKNASKLYRFTQATWGKVEDNSLQVFFKFLWRAIGNVQPIKENTTCSFNELCLFHCFKLDDQPAVLFWRLLNCKSVLATTNWKTSTLCSYRRPTWYKDM